MELRKGDGVVPVLNWRSACNWYLSVGFFLGMENSGVFAGKEAAVVQGKLLGLPAKQLECDLLPNMWLEHPYFNADFL